MELTKNSLTVLEKRYLKKEDGKVAESPHDMFERIAKSVASVDDTYSGDAKKSSGEFYDMMTNLYFLPNSPTLMNAGRELGQLSACFVLGIEDSMESIFDTVKTSALIQKSGGGVGFSFSKLRPKNDLVGSTQGISSGPVSFMEVFDVVTKAVKQGGTRRGANLGSLRCDHPDIMEFIQCKQEKGAFENFNISVCITDEFMDALKKNDKIKLRNPKSGKISSSIKAKEIWDAIVLNVWKSGDPGVLFIDRINAANFVPELGEIFTTNPCGEQPLLAEECCNLGSINLSLMLFEEIGKSKVNWELLKDTVHKAVHFLDNVINLNKYPLPEIEVATKRTRKIGLGVMGFADLLIKMGISYNSVDAASLAGEIMSFIQKEARAASEKLGEERGSFPAFDKSLLVKSYKHMRNTTVTTIAPTGTLSLIAGCSSGIEPLFAIAFSRYQAEEVMVEANPLFEAAMKSANLHTPDIVSKVEKFGSIQSIKEIPENIKKLFVTSHDILPEQHIKMQAEFQKYTCNATSKTINCPQSATVEDISKAYMMAYDFGCKGITVYRDKSKAEQVFYKGTDKKQEVKKLPTPRPESLHGVTKKVKTGCGSIYITINEDAEGNLFEVFTRIEAGGCASSQSEAIGRLVALALRSGISPEAVVKQMKGISCHSPMLSQKGKILSCSDAVARAIEWYVKDDKKAKLEVQEKSLPDKGACPECGGQLINQEGCIKCLCGFSEC